MIKACLFDFDGVIADTEKFHALAFQEYLKETYGISISIKSLQKYEGFTGVDKLRIVLPRYGKKYDESASDTQKLISIYRRLVARHLHPRKGFISLLRRLKKHNVKIGIVTSLPHHDICIFIERFNLNSYIDSVVGLDDTIKHKPFPDPYRKAMENLGVKPFMCCAIEDSQTGLTSAIRANIKFLIQFSKKKSATTKIFAKATTFAQLAKVCKKIIGVV